MAGVRKTTRGNGKYQGWFFDRFGKRRYVVGTKRKAETLRIVEKLEDDERQIRLGYRPAPDVTAKNGNCDVEKIMSEYIAWGESQGGRGGGAWGKTHARMRRTHLAWWRERLEARTLSDLVDCLAAVEEAIRELQKSGRSGKTLQNYAEALKGFCRWCVERKYLADDPLKALGTFDTTPQTMRRAMTPEEIQRLLAIVPDHRRLLYEVAFTTGLRAGELRALTIQHLDTDRMVLRLDAKWTKNRKPGFQPLSKGVVERLKAFAENREALELYKRFLRESDSNSETRSNALLYIPSNTSRMMDEDLKAAGIPKHTAEGKVDFHACRVAYISFIIEAGATVKEAQTMARHSSPDLTMNTYARVRESRCSDLVEKVSELMHPIEKCAHSVHQAQNDTVLESCNSLDSMDLGEVQSSGGGGSRTRYPLPICTHATG